MVLFTLTGLNVDVGLYEFIEYPTYDFPDVSASYYLDLSFNPIYFDNIFYFKTTNPDLNSNVRIEQRTLTQLKNIAVTLGILDNSTVNDILTPRKYKTVIESLNNGTSRLLTADELNKYISTNGYITHLSDGTVVTETQLYSTTYSPLLPEIDEGTTEYSNVQIRNQYAWQNIAINSAGATNNNPKKETQNLYAETSTSWNSLYTQGYGRNLIQVYYSENIFLGVSGEQNLPDMGFKCESSYWPDILFSEGVISNNTRSDIDNYLPPPSANGVHYNKNIGVQWLAKNITGGYNNSDLFANEEALVQQYVNLDPPSVEGQISVNKIRNSYKYYRIIIPSTNQQIQSTNASYDDRAGFTYITVYNNESINNITNLSASSAAGTGTNDFSVSKVADTSTGNSWLSQAMYNDDTGVYDTSSPNTTPTTYLNISGEWIQWEHNEEIIMSKFVIYPGGSSNLGAPPSRIVLVGSNNLSDNWNIIFDITYLFEFQEYSIILEDTIKNLITNTLDVSGGSDTEPLSNLDIGRNNISREALLHLLDNDISANVQRVHNMITNSHSTVDSDDNDISFGDTSNLWIPIEFFDGDIIKFKLIYKPDQITNGSGAAVDDSGNALGTNIIDDQDYVVRLNIVGNRSDLFLRSSFLSSSVVENNVTINGNNHTLLDNIIQPNSSVNRNSNTISVNNVTVYNDTTFGSYVKVGRAHVGPTNSGDTLYNYYTWNKNKFNQKTINYNWTYGSLYNNSVYLTWIFRLHSGGYNKSIASQDIVPISYSTSDNVDLTNDSINIFSEGTMTNVLNNPQQFAVFYSKHFGDANRNCTFGFFNGKYHFCNGAMGGAVSIPLSSSMTNASEQQWRVLTLAIGPHSNNSGSNSEVSIFENGILLGNTNRNFSTLGGSYGDNSTAFGISGQGDNFVMGSFQGQGGTIDNHLDNMALIS